MFRAESVVWATTQIDIVIEGISFASSVHRHITHAADCSVHTNTSILVYAFAVCWWCQYDKGQNWSWICQHQPPYYQHWGYWSELL